MRAAAAAFAAAVLVTVSACTATPAPSARPSPTPTTQAPRPGRDHVAIDPVPAGLEWSPVADSRDESLVVTDWGEVRVTDMHVMMPPGHGPDLDAGSGFRFSDSLADGPYLLTVAQDDAEMKPARVRIYDQRSGTVRRLGPPRAPAVTTGGSWAVGSGRVAYASYQGRRYCLAVADLHTGRGKVLHCAAPRTGLTDFRISDAGLTALSFDDHRPVSCRTAVLVGGDGKTTAVPGPSRCKAWTAVTLDGGAFVWAEVPNENEVAAAHYYVRTSDGSVSDLGMGLSLIHI